MKLAVALDLDTKQESLALVRELASFPIVLKIGMRAFIRDGKACIAELKSINPKFEIFLDLKLYDIPNTMSEAVCEIANLGIEYFTVHASAGSEALKACAQALKAQNSNSKMLAVTALTSFSNDSFLEIYNSNLATKAVQFAGIASECGCDGVVCSAYESIAMKGVSRDGFLTVTPGIRLFGESAGDQKRVADLEFAKEAKSDMIVVGRPIYEAKEPKSVVQRIFEKM